MVRVSGIGILGRLFCLFAWLCFANSIYAQNPKSLAKEAKDLVKAQKFNEAIEKYNAALQLKPNEAEWLSERAACHALQNRYKQAAADYKLAMTADPKNADYCERAGECLFLAGEYALCMETFAKLSNQYLVVSELGIERTVECRLHLKDFEGAIREANEALNDFKDNEAFFFFRAAAYDGLKNYQAAVLSYQDAVAALKAKDSKKRPLDKIRLLKYLKAQARVQMLLFQHEEARKAIEEGFAIASDDKDLILLRARVSKEDSSFQNSLDDFNRFLALDTTNLSAYLDRALVYRKLGQFLNAAKDLSVIITKNDTASNVIELRAKCYEDIGNYRSAQADFKRFRELAKPTQKLRAETALKRVESKLYEKEKENTPPAFIIRSPEVIGNEMSVSKSASFITIRGIIEDASLIKSVTADGIEGDFSRDSLNPSFRIVLNVTDKEEITIKVSDVYLNVTTRRFRFSRVEKNKPELELYIPVSTVSSEIYHDPALNPILRIDGKVLDESLINQIVINGFHVNFDTKVIHPEFHFDLKVTPKDSVKIIMEDEYGNKSVHRYGINAKEAAAIRTNPMGRTWLVFIENSDYLEFERLDGPAKDAHSIKTALTEYRFDNLLTKRNLSLAAMDKFFRIELRDMIRQQQVNSVMIWFAGHGKFLNGSGYWIPSDSKKNDEASFFPISNLKGYLENYGPQLKHILIVSDACESGEAFRLDNQSEVSRFSCSDAGAKEPVSVVFSSTSSEKASDNSLFAKTFAGALQGNTAACISLTELAKLVSDAVEKNQRQNTRIGLIKGLPNKGGSFLFVKSKP